MRITKITILIFFIFTFSSSVWAISTQEMLSLCKPIVNGDTTADGVYFPKNFSTGECWGAFTTFQAAMAVLDGPNSTRTMFGVCAPKESTLTQMISIFSSYADKHPERLHENFFFVAQNSLREVFPCEIKKKKKY